MRSEILPVEMQQLVKIGLQGDQEQNVERQKEISQDFQLFDLKTLYIYQEVENEGRRSLCFILEVSESGLLP